MNSEIIKHVLRREGGDKITRDPDDPGGLTKFGISKRSNPDIDIENLTEDEAVLIYLEKYWKPSRASELSLQLQDMYFDMVVNFGQRRAVKILQQASNHKSRGKPGKLIVDGLRVLILGEPNVGKSTLLNSLIEEEKAIVTDTRGTTRDIVDWQSKAEFYDLSLIHISEHTRRKDIT